MSIVYTPPVSPRFVGNVVCQYETCIVGEPTCSSANVIISVLPEVVAEDDIVSVLSTTSNGGESINVLENDDTIPSGYYLIVQAITSPPALELPLSPVITRMCCTLLILHSLKRSHLF